MKLSVYAMLGEDCTTLEDGRKLWKHIFPELKEGRKVDLDFAGVQVFAASFFNSSLGFLLRDFDPLELSQLVKVSNLTAAGREVLGRVIKNSRRYYQEIRGTPGNRLLRGVNLGIGNKEQERSRR